MTNPVQSKNVAKQDFIMPTSFSYFPQGSDPQVYWGSEKHQMETCPPSLSLIKEHRITLSGIILLVVKRLSVNFKFKDIIYTFYK